MSFLKTASLHTARLRVSPAPTTSSESSAILRRLKLLGSISTFLKASRSQEQCDTGGLQKSEQVGEYSIVYTSMSSDLRRLSANEDSTLNFEITTNDNIPDPQALDPFNVRGLLDRKPAPASQIFQCTLTLDPNHDSDTDLRSSRSTSDLHHRPFTINKRDIFGQILAKSHTPNELIYGLLPRTETDSPRKKAQAMGQSSNKDKCLSVKAAARIPLAQFSLVRLYEEGRRKAE